VGIVLDVAHAVPANPDSAEDKAAADRLLQWSSGVFLHPIFHGDYPEVVKAKIRQGKHPGSNATWPFYFTEEEIKNIKGIRLECIQSDYVLRNLV
jgi:beta-glucosidase/6-phospho-beta-glucosidase/beta-galactosidase